MQLQSFQKNIL